MPDVLTPAQRSYCMSRIRSKDTTPERLLRSMLHKAGFRFRKHSAGLPGKPDIVFVSRKVVVFVEGDFWHGYRFPSWKRKLKPYWRKKIERNRRRDRRTFARLRRMGWLVVRVWEHELKKDSKEAVGKVLGVLERRGRLVRGAGR